MQQKFFDLIHEENKKGATILFSSHILSEVQKLCTRVGIIKEGKIVKVEDINTLKSANYKKFKIEMKEAVSTDYFDFAGINDLTVEETTVSFIYSGDINKIIEKVYERKINNLIVEEPTLEEIFMHYYQKEA